MGQLAAMVDKDEVTLRFILDKNGLCCLAEESSAEINDSLVEVYHILGDVDGHVFPELLYILSHSFRSSGDMRHSIVEYRVIIFYGF
jgi:hypothetical protein